MKPRIIAIGILGIISLIGIINSVLGNVAATLLQDKLGGNVEIVIIPFVVLAAVLIGYEMRGQLSQIFTQDSSKKSLRQRLNRSRMIDKVEAIWIRGFLESSLYKITKIELQLENDPTFVEFPWEGVVQRVNLPNRPISSSKDVYKVFKEIGEELLILGAPGSGKTTLLLELAKDLLVEARTTDNAPIPVVFNLSTWSINRKSLNFWLVDELISKYDVPHKLAKEWIEGNAVLPLLDGLDEVQSNYREQCVETINEYRQKEDFIPIAVCCRIADYESLKEKLRFQAAIAIKPLSKKQIKDYFRHESLMRIRQKVKEDAQLSDLLDNPLMLNIVTLAFIGGDIEISSPKETIEQRSDYIFDAYIDAMFNRRTKNTKFKREDTIRYLSWLAYSMKSNFQSTFHLENLQPEWLEVSAHKKTFVLLDRIVMPLITGAIIGSVGFLIASILEKHNLLIYFITRIDNNSVSIFIFGFSRGYAVLTGFLTTMCMTLFGGLNLSKLTLLERLKKNLEGVFIGGVVGAITGLLMGYQGEISQTIPPDYMIVGYVPRVHIPFVFTGALISLVVSIISGGPSLQVRHIYPIEKARWSPSRALYFLVYTILGTIALTTIYSLITAVPFLTAQLTNSIIGDGLIIGLALGVLLALIGGFQFDLIEVKSLINQGIIRSRAISLYTGVGLVISIGILGGIIGKLMEINFGNLLLNFQFYFFNGESFSYASPVKGALAGLIIGLSEIIPIAIAVALAYGGYASFTHFSLRLVLWLNKVIPFNYIEFLDHSANRILLRKIGGGYAFVHRLLLERFAKKFRSQ